MKSNILAVLLLFFLLAGVLAQEDEGSDYEVRPFQLTFVTPLGTNGTRSPSIINNFSFNILAGCHGGVDGFEMGSVLNLSRDYVSGFQLAGFGNIVGGSVDAVQLAGFMNINGGTFEGFQTSGFLNIVGGNVEAVQLAGFANVTEGFEGVQVSGFGNIAGEIDGIQVAGFMNLADDVEGIQTAGFLNVASVFEGIQLAGFLNSTVDFEGIQTAGFLNATGDFEGVQVAGFLNTTKDFEGIQLAGFLNVARKMKGIQIAGFINICDTIDGIPLAPISLVKKGGYRRFEFWGNETFFMNASFKIGIRHLYTIFSLGYKPVASDYNTGGGAGVGTNLMLANDKSLDIDMYIYNVNKNFWETREYNQLNKLKVSFCCQLADHFSIFAGPSFNLLISDLKESADEIAPSWAFNIADRKNSTRGWFGFNLGMRF